MLSIVYDTPITMHRLHGSAAGAMFASMIRPIPAWISRCDKIQAEKRERWQSDLLAVALPEMQINLTLLTMLLPSFVG